MSSDVFPVLLGIKFDNKRTPVWSTKTHKSVSGKQQRAAMWSYPVWKYSLSYEVLRADTAHQELQTLVGFFLEHQGAFDSWLYSDPSDNTVVGQSIGIGNGSTTAFQLVRTYGANGNTFAEPMTAINGTPVIKVSGVTKTAGVDYTINSTGLVTFTSAPASSAPITADFSYYFRCHFTADELEFNQFMYQLWEAQTVEFETLK
jgi:uncharacterized protein (TIGR02217 family)